jgi:predicted DsbA family dithiol-disulfide isomerase
MGNKLNSKSPLTIEVVSDVVCPWCFIGMRRLERAIALVREGLPDFQYVLRWRPFFLNPDTPPEGEPYLPFLVQKFGGRERVDEIWQRIREVGTTLGIDYQFEKIQVRANTLNAHRLIHWAQERGDATALVERLFVAQFEQGENVSDAMVLGDIAVG